jgi:acyl-CoA thioester hydrolase
MTEFRARLDVPEGAFVQPMRVRSYEVDRRGQLSVGTILRHIESAATEHSASVGFDFAWYERAGAAWVVRDMRLRVSALPGIGEELLVGTWVGDFRYVQANREYAIWRARDARLVARAIGRWAYVDRVRAQPMRIPPAFSASFTIPESRFAPRDLPEPPAGGTLPPGAVRNHLRLVAREYEMDAQGHINNCVYADWLAEGLRLAALQLDIPNPGFWRSRDLRIEYVRPVLADDLLMIQTTILAGGRRALLAWQEITRVEDGTPIVRARVRYLLARG